MTCLVHIVFHVDLSVSAPHCYQMVLTQHKSSLALFDSARALQYALRKSACIMSEQNANEMFTRLLGTTTHPAGAQLRLLQHQI